MKRIYFIIVFYLVFVILFGACAPLYVPNAVNTPMLEQKGDINAAINYGLSGSDFQAAYAVSDNIGVVFNASYMNETSDSTDNFHKHIFFEGGTGYFMPIGDYFQFETYAGYGFGRINSYQSSGVFSSYANSYVNRFFVQPAFAFKTDYFEMAFAPRTCFALISQDGITETGVFAEPVVLLKAGGRGFKFVTQLGFSYLLNYQFVTFNYEPFIFSFGLQYSFRKVKSENKF